MELLLLNKSLIYETIVDIREQPKIGLCALLAGTSTYLYVSGYGPVGIVMYTFFFYECLFRLLFLLWIATHLL
jgi:hypothetical protein